MKSSRQRRGSPKFWGLWSSLLPSTNVTAAILTATRQFLVILQRQHTSFSFASRYSRYSRASISSRPSRYAAVTYVSWRSSAAWFSGHSMPARFTFLSRPTVVTTPSRWTWIR